MDIYFATTNPGKVTSMQKDFADLPYQIIQKSIELAEPRSESVEEISLAKISQAYELIQAPTITSDSGFFIQALEGFPGTYVNPSLKKIKIEGILKLMEEKANRRAKFVDCISYMAPDISEPLQFISEVHGKIALSSRGEISASNWSKLHSIFIPKGSEKTLAEMNDAESSAWRKEYRQPYSSGTQLKEWLSSR